MCRAEVEGIASFTPRLTAEPAEAKLRVAEDRNKIAA